MSALQSGLGQITRGATNRYAKQLSTSKSLANSHYVSIQVKQYSPTVEVSKNMYNNSPSTMEQSSSSTLYNHHRIYHVDFGTDYFHSLRNTGIIPTVPLVQQ